MLLEFLLVFHTGSSASWCTSSLPSLCQLAYKSLIFDWLYCSCSQSYHLWCIHVSVFQVVWHCVVMC